jgi:hypothetical protein
MANYDRPTKTLMLDWVKENLKPGQIFSRGDVARWFAEHYPKTKRSTVNVHVDVMSTNNTGRKHHNIRPGNGFDLFFKLGPNAFRLWDQATDPPPFYKGMESISDTRTDALDDDDAGMDESNEAASAAAEFAFERDLQNYLVKNLGSIEPGLRLYEDEDIKGVEFPAGSRRIDILALDKDGGFVVIELKVSRGYDRVIGQLLRYMGWVHQNMETTRPVRGMIVANEITADLKLAAMSMPLVKLIEYKLSFELSTVPPFS